MRLDRLLLVFLADFAARDQPERPHVLTDALFVYGDLAGLEIGVEAAVCIAHHDLQQYFSGGTADDGIGGLGETRTD